MTDQSAKQRLEAKRTELEGELEEMGSGAGFLGMFLGLFGLVMPYVFIVMALGWEEHFEHGIGFGINVTFLIILTLTGMFGPVFLVPHLLQRGYRKRYRYVWRWLKYTDAPKFVIDQELWDEVFAILDRQPLLKLTGVRMPRSLDEQIELASDYWPVVEAMVRGDRRRLFWRVAWGSLTRLSDTLALFCFNGCAALILMMVTAIMFFLPLLPLYGTILPLYVNRQGAQQALVDWFLNTPRSWVGKVEPFPKEPKKRRARKR